MRRRGLWLFVFALIIALVSTWLNNFWTEQQQLSRYKQDNNKISYYFTQFTLLTTDGEGSGQYRLSGNHLSHWQEKKFSEIITPEIIALDQQQVTMQTRADVAYLNHQDNSLSLEGNVILKQQHLAAQSHTLTTEKLVYFHHNQQIETDQPFKLQSAHGVLQGRGLELQLNNKQMKVLSNVQTSYTPTVQ